MTLRQLIGVAYEAFCERIGREKADETLAAMAAIYEPARTQQPTLTGAERQARAQLLSFGGGGVSSPA